MRSTEHRLVNIIRPHRSTMYVDAAYCYRPSSVVGRSVCRSVTVVSPATTDELIKMPFRMISRIDPVNHVLDGVQMLLWEWTLRGVYGPLQSIGFGVG